MKGVGSCFGRKIHVLETLLKERILKIHPHVSLKQYSVNKQGRQIDRQVKYSCQ